MKRKDRLESNPVSFWKSSRFKTRPNWLCLLKPKGYVIILSTACGVTRCLHTACVRKASDAASALLRLHRMFPETVSSTGHVLAAAGTQDTFDVVYERNRRKLSRSLKFMFQVTVTCVWNTI